jgi:predicted RNase H-like HicB family nuclease
MREFGIRTEPSHDDAQLREATTSLPQQRGRLGAFYHVDVARIPGCWVLSVPCLPEVVEYVERLEQAEPRARQAIAAALGVPCERVTVDLQLSAGPPNVAAGRAAPQLSQDALDPSPY